MLSMGISICVMSHFENLPRDLQLIVLSKLDMDGRIRCGIVGRLEVPRKFVVRLRRVFTFKLHVFVGGDRPFGLSGPWMQYLTRLGMVPPEDWLDVWYTREFPVCLDFLEGWRPYRTGTTRSFLLGARYD